MGTLDNILARAFIADDPGERVIRLRGFLDERMEAIRALHAEGVSGRRVVLRMTRLMDELLISLYSDAAVRYLGDRRPIRSAGLALVAVGGYGRDELNPHSDIDLLFLFDPRYEDTAKAIANDVLYPLWDLKLTVGHSVRTVADCLEMGQDLSAKTCMMESRLLVGDGGLYERFLGEFGQKVVRRDVPSFLFQKAEEQRSRHERFGSTVFLQQPNVKESAGALRDIHYLHWVALARYGTGNLKKLSEQGLIDPQDQLALVKAQGFLWRIRNDLHFHYGKRMDVLDFEEQLRISEWMGFTDSRGSRAVERFMRRYFTHASRVLDICTRFIDRAAERSRSRSITEKLFSRRVPPYFTLTNWEIRVDPGKEKAFFKDGEGVMTFLYLAQTYGLRLHPDTVERLSHVRPTGRSFRSPKACKIFMDILRWESGIAETLQRMHRMRVLGRVLPEFSRVDRLVTFSLYHKYTVDAHSLHAMEVVESLRERDDTYGEVYRKLKRKDLLHLAILLHDSGKGQHRNHCEAGEELVRSVAPRMGLSESETDLVAFLVKNHLEMSHIAFRRDLSDPKVLTEFARSMQTTERLKMLYVLTHVDISAVGPGTWNEWKSGLLTELYGASLEILGGRSLVKDKDAVVNRKREALAEVFGEDARPWLDETLTRIPGRYLLSTPVEEIEVHLSLVRKLKEQPAVVEITPHRGGDAEIVVCAHDQMVPGLFSRIAGTLTAKEMEIQDARITTLRDDVILDVFRVRDPSATGFIDYHRWNRLRDTLTDVLQGNTEVESLFEGGHGRVVHEDIDFSHTEPQVKIDNGSSESFSVIDVFAADRQGLLYALTGAIADLGLSIYFSRIATKADQVVDVFYVKGPEGGKVTDPEMLRHIEETLLRVVSTHKGIEPQVAGE
ncbi:MAG: [protein-PII] uridylyltransferase [Leptospirillia bacterium]